MTRYDTFRSPHAELAAQIAHRGFVLVENVVDEATLLGLCQALAGATGHSIMRGGRVYAVRNALELPEVRGLAYGAALKPLLGAVLGDEARPVRAILFDKVPGANWHVGWHQDLVVPVRQRRDVDGFGPWSNKAGVPHVKPPAAVLAGMLAIRVHLDDCGQDNGPLRVVPGSHQHGELSAAQIRRLVENGAIVTCAGRRGSVLAMRPLLLHASAKSFSPGHRRVLHIDYAGTNLPGGLEWPTAR